MDFTLIQSLWSIVILVTFLGIVFWAYSSKRKQAFDEAARLPFEEDDPRGAAKTTPEQHEGDR